MARPGRSSMASRTHLALGCSVLVHALTLAMTLLMAHAPAPVSDLEAEPIAVVFEAAVRLQSKAAPQTEVSPELVSPPATPTAPQAPPPEPLPAIQLAEVAIAPLPLLAEPPTSSIYTPPLPPLSEWGRSPEAVQGPTNAMVPLASSPASVPQPDITPNSPISPVPQSHTQAPVPAIRPPAPSKPAPSRSLPKAVRPKPTSHPAAPSTRTPEPIQPFVPPIGRLQQVAPVIPRSAPPAPMEVSSTWRSALAGWLQSHRTYPDEARRQAEEGTVLIRFSMARDGRVLDVTLVHSSGSSALDEAAQATFRNARMPPFTADMTQAQTTVTVPIRYRLEQ